MWKKKNKLCQHFAVIWTPQELNYFVVDCTIYPCSPKWILGQGCGYGSISRDFSSLRKFLCCHRFLFINKHWHQHSSTDMVISLRELELALAELYSSKSPGICCLFPKGSHFFLSSTQRYCICVEKSTVSTWKPLVCPFTWGLTHFFMPSPGDAFQKSRIEGLGTPWRPRTQLWSREVSLHRNHGII